MNETKTAVDTAKLKNYFGKVLDPLNSRSYKARNWDLDKVLAWYEDATVRSAHRMMGDIKGRKVLEIGFGTGAHLAWLARRGAIVTGVDISPERVRAAKDLMESEGLSGNVSVMCQDIMATDLPEEAFDIIYGHDILMYMGGDYPPFAQKAYSMLKEGGKLIVVEALDNHPAARIYRNIFAPREFRYFTRYFNIAGLSAFRSGYRRMTSEFFYILAPLAFIWKNWITSKTMFDIFERSLTMVDKRALKKFPALEKYCWRVVFEAQK